MHAQRPAHAADAVEQRDEVRVVLQQLRELVDDHEKRWQRRQIRSAFPVLLVFRDARQGTGRADLAFTTILDVIFAKEQNAPIVSIGAYSQSNNWGLIGRQGETFTVASLKGKKIGIYNDAWTKAQLAIMLSSAGLTLDDVKMVAAANDVVPLLLQKKVDVATGVTNAEASEVRTVGKQKPEMLLAKDYGVPNSPIWLIAANTDWAKKTAEIEKAAVFRLGLQAK